MAKANIELRVYGPEVDDSITLCQDDDYLLVFECVVTDSTNLVWTLMPILSTYSIGRGSVLGKDQGERFTVVLSEKADSMYDSQLQVSTTELIQEMTQSNSQLEAICQGTSESKRKHIMLSGM